MNACFSLETEFFYFFTKNRNTSSTYLVGGGYLLAVDGERHQASGQVDETANLQVHVAATGGVGSVGHISTPNDVAVTPLHTMRVRISVIEVILRHSSVLIKKVAVKSKEEVGFLKNTLTFHELVLARHPGLQ